MITNFWLFIRLFREFFRFWSLKNLFADHSFLAWNYHWNFCHHFHFTAIDALETKFVPMSLRSGIMWFIYKMAMGPGRWRMNIPGGSIWTDHYRQSKKWLKCSGRLKLLKHSPMLLQSVTRQLNQEAVLLRMHWCLRISSIQPNQNTWSERRKIFYWKWK